MDRLALKKTNKEPAAFATVNPNFLNQPAGAGSIALQSRHRGTQADESPWSTTANQRQ
jgi:hypothetical protein